MNINDVVVYIDAKGVPHNALVKALNQLHEGFISVGYQDNEGRTVDVNDVPHMSHESRQELNPDLPTFHINCCKYADEDHNRAPKDHPMFDHPFAPPTLDNDGRIIAKPRPEFEKVVAEHQAGKAEAAPETKLPQGGTSGLKIETKNYTDGSSATGPAPLPDQSPAQQDAAKAALSLPAQQAAASEPDVTTLLDQAPAAPDTPAASK
jgi:hypothetical protein